MVAATWPRNALSETDRLPRELEVLVQIVRIGVWPGAHGNRAERRIRNCISLPISPAAFKICGQ